MKRIMIGFGVLLLAFAIAYAISGSVGIALLASIPVLILMPPSGDPAIQIKEHQQEPDDGRTPQHRADIAAIEKGLCPDCGTAGSLCAGPSGGMSQNVACNHCFNEFNVHHSFGGLLKIDRSGKLTPDRARYAFGIEMPDAA